LQHFWTILQRGADRITTDTYLNAAVPGRFCPNFGFHFKPHNEVWPTLADPVEHFELASLVGLEAQVYNPMIIEVHSDRWAPIPALLTGDGRLLPPILLGTKCGAPPRWSPSRHLDMAPPYFNPFELLHSTLYHRRHHHTHHS
jgi:hypothetical protein